MYVQYCGLFVSTENCRIQHLSPKLRCFWFSQKETSLNIHLDVYGGMRTQIHKKTKINIFKPEDDVPCYGANCTPLRDYSNLRLCYDAVSTVEVTNVYNEIRIGSEWQIGKELEGAAVIRTKAQFQRSRERMK
jgi:hypothetical protein